MIAVVSVDFIAIGCLFIATGAGMIAAARPLTRALRAVYGRPPFGLRVGLLYPRLLGATIAFFGMAAILWDLTN